jgi:hypothetical protein
MSASYRPLTDTTNHTIDRSAEISGVVRSSNRSAGAIRQRLPGILPWQRASEAFQRVIFCQHRDGVNRSRLARREGIGAATVESYFQRRLQRQFAAWHTARATPPRCAT